MKIQKEEFKINGKIFTTTKLVKGRNINPLIEMSKESKLKLIRPPYADLVEPPYKSLIPVYNFQKEYPCKFIGEEDKK